MPLQPTTPVPQPPVATIAILAVTMQAEPQLSVQIVHAPSDALGNQIGPATTSTLGAPALAALGLTKAKLYAALQAHIPALAGTVV